MEKDVKTRQLQSTNPRRPGQALLTSLCGLAMLTAVCAMGLLCLLDNSSANDYHTPNQGSKIPPATMFRGWDKPDVALVLSGQMYGYLQPCGCSDPQYGGLSRRYNVIKSLEHKGWPVVPLDLGDIAQKSGPQRDLKYQYAKKALSKMNYAAVGIGEKEFNMSFFTVLAEQLNNPEPPILAANLIMPEAVKDIQDFTQGWRIVEDKERKIPPIGVIGLVGRSVSDKVNDPDVKFAVNNGQILNQALAAMAGKTQLNVLLYQGNLQDAEMAAKHCALLRKHNPQLPSLDVLLCLSREEEPPSTPYLVKEAPNTIIVNVGHKGRYVGVVGAFKTNVARQPYSLKYQLVSIGPEYQTPKGQEKDNPVMALMEEYAWAVKDGEYILKYPTVQHPVQTHYPSAQFVGSLRCAGCHQHAYDVWEKSHHAHAYKTLEDAVNPGLRNHDGECIVCHVIGFNHPTGYGDALRDNDPKMLRRLRDVGCESCHGPGSVHVKNTHDTKLHALMNPWKATPEELNPATDKIQRIALQKKRILKMDLFCQKCHDADNDVHWNFEKKWPMVVHMTPEHERKQRNGGQANQQPIGAEAPNPAAQNIAIPQIPQPIPQPELQFPSSGPQQPYQYPSSGPQFPPYQNQPETQPQQPERRFNFNLNPFRWFRKSN